MKKIIVAYIPVLHEGYRRFLENNRDASAVYIFGEEIIKEFDHLAKEIRALGPKLLKKSLNAWGTLPKVFILDKKTLGTLNLSSNSIVIPDEDVTKELAEKYLSKAHILHDPIFLRWDKHKSAELLPVKVEQRISSDEVDKKIIKDLQALGENKSSDWWRRIGAAIVKGNKVILKTYNKHVPSPHTPYANGDPRNNFHKGINVDLSTALHAEAGLIAEAAKKGVSLKGLSLYVSTFPCSGCAKLVAYSGIKKVYYTGGYKILDNADILRVKGVEIIFVDIKT